ncbi:MAG: MMPL family transporter [Mycobacterium sp.]|nr:MMPL family transporter [Mycobacterium sp.]
MGSDLLHRLAQVALTAPRRVLAGVALLIALLGIFSSSVVESLSAGGGFDPNAESARANTLLEQKFGRSPWQLMITVSAQADVRDGPARVIGTSIVDQLSASPHVLSVASPWTVPPPDATRLISRDGSSGLIVAAIDGDEGTVPARATELARQVVIDRKGVTVRAGGVTMFSTQIEEQTKHDLLLMESIAIPISFFVLVWVFGGLVAAALPVAVGVMTIVGSLAALKLIAYGTEVSLFALNLCVGLGFALAVDYTLLIVSRYRDELADGRSRDAALVTTLVVAGRTVLYSAITVAVSLVALVLFPTPMLRSLAYAGIAAVGFAAFAAIIVAPAAIVLLGDRMNALDVRKLIRRESRASRPVEDRFLYRTTRFVMHRPIPVATAVVVLLLMLGAPFLNLKLGSPDDRMLPESTSARQVGDQLRDDYVINEASAVTVVIPDVTGLAPETLHRYAAQLSGVAHVSAVSAPVGTYVSGAIVGPPSDGGGEADGSAFMTITSTAPALSDGSDIQLEQLRAVATPGERSVLFTGMAQGNRDNVESITKPLPWVLGTMAVTVLVLLFLLTGSLVIPIKALALGALSLTATMGALVWIFQEGHLGALGTTSTGTLSMFLPVPLLCFAFALSMDYEVFLVSRIREYWLKSERTQADNEESVVLGVTRSGRVVTAAALLMAIPFAAQIGGQVALIRMFGVGLTIALLVDATLIRMALLPAFMQLLGRWNWWAPGPLARLHERRHRGRIPASPGRHPA